MHHVPLFDHGILINRGSTDHSLEMCRQFAPHWEVRHSRVPEFDPIQVDAEVMEIEKECAGWKMVLNTTEFLCCWDKQPFFDSLPLLGEQMYSIRTIVMVDPLNAGYPDPVYTVPLVKQRHHGYFPHDPNQPFIGRFIHKYGDGSYTPGRHWSPWPYRVYPSPAFILKFVFSPWNEAMRQRKLQIGPTLSSQGKQLGLGTYHLTTKEQLEHTYLHFAGQTEDLRLIPEYRQLGLL
ncbi:hypothetical protein [Paenibacillus rigui]|uniref:Glycosyltransferase family 2 protein n=1 Tax=Paenibacillus rigui TaxID=554312 RepID=A0A229ULQ8_9BACL|nr:hypothetical protein CF651_21420 [Paenibacillus rigui]